MIYPYSIWFSFRLFKNTLKCINNTNTFLPFQGITEAYLLNKSVTHNKYLIPLLD